MATITWGGTTGFWNIASNWIGGLIPTSADFALINGGTVTNNAAANISSVAINNAATLSSSANLNVTTSIGVGASGSGRADLNVSGGTVSAGTSVAIGAVAGNSGFVSVFNTGVLQANTIAVGSASTGTLSIFGGGSVSATSGFTVGSGANLGTINIGETGLAGTINGNIAFGNAGSRIIFNSSNTASYAGNISGAGSVTVNSSGQLAVLTGTNTHSGATTITAGTLQIGNGGTGGSLGSGAVSIGTGGTLAFQHSAGQYVNANVISGAGAVVQRGGNNVLEALTGNNSYTGTTTIDGGVLTIGSGGTSGTLGSGDVIFANGGNLDLFRSDTQLIANNISGAGGVRVIGNHTGILTGTNSSSGTTFIGAGSTLQIGNGGGSGTLGSGSVTNDGILAFNRSTDSSVAGVISGTGGLVKDGGGDIYLTAANTYAGTTTINAGRINIGSIGGNGTTGSLGTGAVVLGGTAELNYFRSNDATIANAISGNGFFTKAGVGILTLMGADTHSGVTQILGGTLRGGGANVFSVSALMNIVTGARLDVGGFNQSIGGLVGSGIVENSGATARALTLNVSGASTFAGVIQDGAASLGLVKTGAGTQTLSGVNTYTNSTNIAAGTLALTGSGSIAGLVQVVNAARFDISGISGASTAVRDVLINSGGQIILGGKTLNVIGADSFAGPGAFVGSAGTDAVVFSVTSPIFTLAGTNGAVFTNWTDGIDSITINGNANANNLTGDELRATIINGGDGADTIMGGAGNDRLNGGAGIDTISYANSTFGVTVHLDDPTAQNTVQQGFDTISGFENIIGSASHDMLFGDDFDNVITAGAGFDTITSGGGTNTLIGGDGGDLYFVQGVNDVIIEAVGGGYDIVLSQVNFTLGAGSEVEALAVNTSAGISLTGNEFQQVLTGNVGSDTLSGGGGNDLIISGLGTNTLIGGTGDDIYYSEGLNDVITEAAGGGFDVVLASGNLTLAANSEVEFIAVNTANGVTITGSNSNQTIQGAGGNDRLVGGLGNDTLQGSGGADTFVLGNTFADRDFIVDFASGSDRLEISAALFGGGLAAGMLSASQFLSGAGATAATTADQRFIYNSSTGNLLFDADGNGAGAAVLFASLLNVPALTAADFLIAG